MKLQQYIAVSTFSFLAAATTVVANDQGMTFPPAGEYMANTPDQFHTDRNDAGVPCSWTTSNRRALNLGVDGTGQLAIRVDIRNERCGLDRWEPSSCSNTLHLRLQSSGEFETIMTQAVCENATAGQRLRGKWETYSADSRHFLALTYQDGTERIYVSQ